MIVFPKEAVGRKVSAQGTFEEIATSPVREAHGEHAKSAENSGKPPATTPTAAWPSLTARRSCWGAARCSRPW